MWRVALLFTLWFAFGSCGNFPEKSDEGGYYYGSLDVTRAKGVNCHTNGDLIEGTKSSAKLKYSQEQLIVAIEFNLFQSAHRNMTSCLFLATME